MASDPNNNTNSRKRHKVLLTLAIGFALLSLAAFAFGTGIGIALGRNNDSDSDGDQQQNAANTNDGGGGGGGGDSTGAADANSVDVSEAPSYAPTKAPTSDPTNTPTVSPTDVPTDPPTISPTEFPTDAPTESPTYAPTQAPTTDAPTHAPSNAPTNPPTTRSPTVYPTQHPTTPSPTSSTTTIVLYPTDDATISEVDRDATFGTTTDTLRIRGAGSDWSYWGQTLHSLLKFDVSSLYASNDFNLGGSSPTNRALSGATMEKAVLQLYCVDGSPYGGKIRHSPSATWSEDTVSWGKAPGGGDVIGLINYAVEEGNWYEVDVTELVLETLGDIENGDEGVFGLRIVSPNGDAVAYSSKEDGDGNGPRIVVTLKHDHEPTSQPPTDAPTTVPTRSPVAPGSPTAKPTTAIPTTDALTPTMHPTTHAPSRSPSPPPTTQPTTKPTPTPTTSAPVTDAPVSIPALYQTPEFWGSSQCQPTSPCPVCYGDCDTDDDCEGNLVCFNRDGITPVPGCEGDGAANYDYCVEPSNTILRTVPNAAEEEGECSLGRRCGRCMGDCDDDSECNNGLVCFQRDGYTPVPGCQGLGLSGWDYCVRPRDLNN